MSKDECYIYFKLIPIVLSVWLRSKKVYLKPQDFEDVCSELYLMYKNENAFRGIQDNMALAFSMFYIRVPKAIKKLRDDNILVEDVDQINQKNEVLDSIEQNKTILSNLADEDIELLKEAYFYEENIELLAKKYNTSVSSIYGKLEMLKRKLKKILDNL
ncbi:MAG TPA: hypothetical protein PKY72_04385 [Bacilli bacterium]|nr:hypothetical protein [Bacilli bacterium]